MSLYGVLNLDALMRDPIAYHMHMYECWMAELGELGALIADPRTYMTAINMSHAKK